MMKTLNMYGCRNIVRPYHSGGIGEDATISMLDGVKLVPTELWRALILAYKRYAREYL